MRVNGALQTVGIRTRRDRDEIRVDSVGSAPLFFSTEVLATKADYPADASATCPHCKLPLEAGQQAVRCPLCGVWHHEMPDEELDCWTHVPECAICRHTTDLTQGFQWTPEEL